MTMQMVLVSLVVTLSYGCGGSVTPSEDSGDGATNPSSQSTPDASVTDGATSTTPSDGATGGDIAVVAGAPASPTNFVETAATQSSISLAWSVSTSSDVSFYNVYRDGKLLAKSTTIAKGADGKLIGTYTDTTAGNAVAPKFDLPPPIYTYAVTAVDSQLRESARQTNLTYWMYNTDVSVNINPTPGNTNPGQGGNMNFANAPGVAGPSGLASIPGNFVQGNYTCAPESGIVFNDTAGDPDSTPFDYAFSGCGYNQPYSGPPTVPEWALDIGTYHYLHIDFKPTSTDTVPLSLGIISRLPQGDVFNQAGVDLSKGTYGPVPKVGVWGSYKIPLKDLQMGTGSIVASIKGNILTVESVSSSGVTVQNAGWVIGGGLSAPVHIDCDGGGQNGNCSNGVKLTGNGGAGTYMISPAPAQDIASTTFTIQRTNMYKMGIGPNGSSGLYYLNKIGWSVE